MPRGMPNRMMNSFMGDSGLSPSPSFVVVSFSFMVSLLNPVVAPARPRRTPVGRSRKPLQNAVSKVPSSNSTGQERGGARGAFDGKGCPPLKGGAVKTKKNPGLRQREKRSAVRTAGQSTAGGFASWRPARMATDEDPCSRMAAGRGLPLSVRKEPASPTGPDAGSMVAAVSPAGDASSIAHSSRTTGPGRRVRGRRRLAACLIMVGSAMNIAPVQEKRPGIARRVEKSAGIEMPDPIRIYEIVYLLSFAGRHREDAGIRT